MQIRALIQDVSLASTDSWSRSWEKTLLTCSSFCKSKGLSLIQQLSQYVILSFAERNVRGIIRDVN